MRSSDYETLLFLVINYGSRIEKVLSRDDTGTRRRFHPVTTRYKEETQIP